jgi:hypothetical protein
MTYDNIYTKWSHFEKELRSIIVEYNVKCFAMAEQEALQCRRAENKALADACFRHKRELDLLAGEKVEPVAHEGEVVIVSKMGGGVE